ncbi:MAG TPA: MFS transporter [Trebonia sp.]|nr:MFS transporter [Trebonia sp.]
MPDAVPDPGLPGTRPIAPGPIAPTGAGIETACAGSPGCAAAGSPRHADPAVTEPPEAKATVTLVLVAAAGLTVSLPMSLLVPVLPQLAVKMHTSATSTEWLLTATLLTGAIAVPVLGRLADLYGKKRVLAAALVVFLAGSLICAFTNDIAVMIAGRAVVGLSVAAIPIGISLVGTVLPASRAGQGIALVSAMLGVGGALGLPVAGVIAQHADYHVLFWICIAGGVITLGGIIALVPEPPVSGHGKLDPPGTILLAVALTSLLLPLAQASVWGWGNLKTTGLLAASVVLLTTFVLVERRRASPVIDVVVNARPALLLTNIASAAVGFALFAVLIGTANFVETPAAAGYGFGSSIMVGGLCLVPSGLFMLLLSPVSAQLSARFGPKVTLALGAAIVAAGFLVRFFLVAHLWEVVAGTAITGAGTGLAYSAMPSLILRAAPPAELAAANGLNSLARMTGSSLASALGGAVLTSQTVTLAGYAFPSLAAYRILFAICAAAALAGAVTALTIPLSSAAADRLSSSSWPVQTIIEEDA